MVTAQDWLEIRRRSNKAHPSHGRCTACCGTFFLHDDDAVASAKSQKTCHPVYAEEQQISERSRRARPACPELAIPPCRADLPITWPSERCRDSRLALLDMVQHGEIMDVATQRRDCQTRPAFKAVCQIAPSHLEINPRVSHFSPSFIPSALQVCNFKLVSAGQVHGAN